MPWHGYAFETWPGDALWHFAPASATTRVLGRPFGHYALAFAEPAEALPESGVAYCFGDPGSGTPYPCINDNNGSVLGSGCDNGVLSTGARLTASAVASLACTARLRGLRLPGLPARLLDRHRPSFSAEATAVAPPCSSMMGCLIANPSPLPFCSIVKSGARTWLACYSAIPTPSYLIVISTYRSSGRRR